METSYTLRHDAEKRCYWFEIEGHKALIEYEVLPDGTLSLDHTRVAPPLEGRGIGRRLVEATLADIRRRGLRIRPQCRFIIRYLERHPEWQELIR